MSAQDAKNFLDAVDQDPELRNQVKGAVHQIVTTAQNHGYNFSGQDLQEELHRRWGMNPPPGGEIDPDTCFCIG
jgi:predicted ribosomally synthesized peptide with nif11-like leader